MLLTNRSKHDQPNKKMNISGFLRYSELDCNKFRIKMVNEYRGGGVAHLYVTGTNVKVSWILFPQFLCQILKRIFLSVSLWKKQIVKKRSQTRDEGKHYLIDRFSGLINSKSTCHLPRAPSFHLIIWRRSLKTLTFIDSHSW